MANRAPWSEAQYVNYDIANRAQWSYLSMSCNMVWLTEHSGQRPSMSCNIAWLTEHSGQSPSMSCNMTWLTEHSGAHVI